MIINSTKGFSAQLCSYVDMAIMSKNIENVFLKCDLVGPGTVL